MAGPKQDRRRAAGLPFTIIATVVRPVLMLITRRRWRGAEHIPPPGSGVLVVANHLSHIDPFTFAHYFWDNGRATRYLAKESLFRIPLAGRLVAAAGQIPVFRESRDASKAYAAAVQAVGKGECVVIYPEGTITKDPDLWPMVGKTGAARVALETGCPVVPVAQWGPNHILAPYAKRPRLLPPTTIHVQAGPPIDFDDLRDRPVTADLLHTATERIMDAITAQLAQIRGARPPARRFDPKAAGLPTTGDPHAGKGHSGRPADRERPGGSDGGPADRARPDRSDHPDPPDPPDHESSPRDDGAAH